MLSLIAERAVPFVFFFLELNVTFAFIFYVLHIKFDETNEKDPEGEYVGVDQIWFIPYMMYAFRNSLGDFKTDTFLFLPVIQMYAVWVMWLLIVLINVMILLNFLIVTIESAYEDLHDKALESSYRKKASILKDLDDVFGKLLDTKAVNILVVRQHSDSSERTETNEQITALRDEMMLNHERLNEKIHDVANKVTEMRSSLDDQLKDQIQMHNKTQEELQNLKGILMQLVK
jgi:hypothetical protein